MLVLTTVLSVMSCGLSDAETDLVADQILNTLMAPLNNAMNISSVAYSMGSTLPGMVAWTEDIDTNAGLAITFQTNTDNGLTFANNWLDGYMEGSVTLSSNSITLAYGHGLADIKGQLILDGVIQQFPATQEAIFAYVSTNYFAPSLTVKGSLFGSLSLVVSGDPVFISDPFSYTISFGNSTADPFSFSTSMDTNTHTITVQVDGLMAYSLVNNALVGSIDYDFNLKLVIDGNTGDLVFIGGVSGTVLYNNKEVAYSIKVLDPQTVEITVEGKTVTRTITAIANMMSPY